MLERRDALGLKCSERTMWQTLRYDGLALKIETLKTNWPQARVRSRILNQFTQLGIPPFVWK